VTRILWAGLFWLCICSFVSLVLPAESATSTWSGFLLLVWLASGLGGGWRAADVDDDTHSSALWVQQLSKYTNRTPHTHAHTLWLGKERTATHTYTLAHWYTPYAQYGEFDVDFGAVAAFTYLCQFLACVCECASWIVARLLLLIFGWLCFYLSI